MRGADVDEEVAQLFLALINVLSLVEPDQAWILIRPLAADAGKTKVVLGKVEGERPKRRIVTLQDVRRMWQEELDRVADLQAGRFPLAFDGGGSGMEVDVFAS